VHYPQRTNIQNMKGCVPFIQSLGPKWCPSPGVDDHTV